ncbi:tyrosine-type recombinase/integrase [Bradyrhizobium lupini]|uniref:tyrosine-type recombinase/integrase n=1 Tax=Rhizobium lupini TaxID=136996 RepID=UPI0034C6590B
MSFAHKDPRTKKLTGKYEVDFWFKAPGEPDKRMRRVFENKKVAEANEAYARQTGRWADPEDDNAAGPTFRQAAEDMRKQHSVWQRGRDPSGQKRLDWIIGKIGHKAIKTVSTEDLQGIVDDLKKRPVKSVLNSTGVMKGRSLNNYLTYASAVLTWAAERPKTYGSFKPPVIPWQDVVKTRIHFMTQEQQRLLIKFYLEKGWLDEAVAAKVLGQAGLRFNELEALEPNMVVVTKRANQQEIGWIKLDETKTDTPRDVPITAQLARELKALLVNGWRANYDRSRWRFNEARKLYGWGPQVSMYKMRHAAATYLTKRGMQPEKIQQFMGHKDYHTTQQYIHLESEDVAEAADFLDPSYGVEVENQPKGNVVAIGKAS